jgi:hypothetical protein
MGLSNHIQFYCLESPISHSPFQIFRILRQVLTTKYQEVHTLNTAIRSNSR